jgi:RimJ/RimL family protein N-acetyltransferase
MESSQAAERLTLRDGTPYAIRPIRPDDAPRLQALHSRLSAESIQLRFMAMHPVLQPVEAERLADVDGLSRAALVAVLPSAGADVETIIGVARYATLGPQRPDQAEAAIVIEDRYQGQGVGQALLHRLLAYGRAHGVRWFVAEVSLENDRMIRFIRRSGLPVEIHQQDGVLHVKADIDPEAGPAKSGHKSSDLP